MWSGVHAARLQPEHGEAKKCEKKTGVCLSLLKGYAFTSSNSGIKHTDPRKWSNVNHNNTDYVYTCNDFPSQPDFFFFFYLGFRSAHWKYQHLVRISLHKSGKPETGGQAWWWLDKCASNLWVPERLISGLIILWLYTVDHRRRR